MLLRPDAAREEGAVTTLTLLLFVACAFFAGLYADARRQLRVARDGWALAEQRNEWYGALAESLCTPGEPAGMASPHLDTAPSLPTEQS